MRNVDVTIQQINFVNGYSVSIGLSNAGLEPFVIRTWHYKKLENVHKHNKIVMIFAKGVADTLEVEIIHRDPFDAKHIRLSDDMFQDDAVEEIDY